MASWLPSVVGIASNSPAMLLTVACSKLIAATANGPMSIAVCESHDSATLSGVPSKLYHSTSVVMSWLLTHEATLSDQAFALGVLNHR